MSTQPIVHSVNLPSRENQGFDYEPIAKSIISMINSNAKAKQSKLDLERDMLLKKVEDTQKLQYEKDKAQILNPKQQQDLDYQKLLKSQHENQMPGYAGQVQSGQGAPAQGMPQMAPGGISSPQAPQIPTVAQAMKPRVEMGASGYQMSKPTMASGRQVMYQAVIRKEGAGFPLTTKDQKIKEAYEQAVFKTEEDFSDNLQKAEAGEMTYDQVRKKFPEKSKQISTARVASMSPKTQNIIEQIDRYTKRSTSIEEYNASIKDVMGNLVEKEDEAVAKGIDVEAILDIMGLTREEVKGLKELNWMGKVGKFLRELNRQPDAVNQDTGYVE